MMKRNIKRLSLAFVLGLTMSLSGCSDNILAELTSLETSQLFSVTGLDARVVNQTQVRLNFKAVKNADSYVAEFFEGANSDFSGTPVLTVADITADQLPYVVVSGLAGETTYTVRIKAIGEGVADSKWMTAVITTGAEQIFLPVNVADIEANEVILRWTPGEIATQIVLEPGNITHTVTAQEIEAGAVTIIGLTPETTYTARLLNDGKLRGTISFTTSIDLGGAILVQEGDDLLAAIANADPGATLALMPGTYEITSLNNQGGNIAISKSISINAARPAERPIIKNGVFRPTEGASLVLNGLIIDGTDVDNQAIVYAIGTYGRLEIQNCEIFGYIKGLLYANLATLIENVSMRNNIMRDIECVGGDFIDFRHGRPRDFEFIDNTVYNCALARDFFRMDNDATTHFPTVITTLTVSNNTFNVVCNGNNRRMLYVRLASHQIHFTKNILANTLGYYTNQSGSTPTIITTMSGNNYFNAPNFTGSTQSGAKNDTGSYTTHNPGFTDPANGNFTVSHEDLIFNQVGDRRWIQ